MNLVEGLLLAAVSVMLIVQLIDFFKRRSAHQSSPAVQMPQMIAQLRSDLEQHINQTSERTERTLHSQVQETAQGTRSELNGSLAEFQRSFAAQMTAIATLQSSHLEGFSSQFTKLNEVNAVQLEAMRQAITVQAQYDRQEQAASLKRFADTLNQTLTGLTESNAQRMLEIRATLEQKIRDLQTDNGARLEEMRKTVDEKLHATLEHRLGESFKLVSDRLEKVHHGLGEMQQLAIGVGDLKRVLTNVKTRGTWGEVQLEMLLEQMLTVDQYAKNVETIGGSGERVEFAIKLPGMVEGGLPVWMPIDAKFPKEQYERLAEAADRADVEGVATAARELERTIRAEAKTIAQKYLSPPLTTDFAILFLPTEGLYAEVMRRPGLADDLQRVFRVSLAGPSTLSALLNSLQMGFRTLALEKRSSEVWQVLGAVKTEFGKFGDVLSATKMALEKAAKNIESAETRSRQMARKLKSVEALPSEVAQALLGAEPRELNDDSEAC
jgi:DNA recombination protein RmuC